MYNVLNNEWERVTVEVINPQIHKHLSGRDFTEDDACVKVRKDIKVKTIWFSNTDGTIDKINIKELWMTISKEAQEEWDKILDGIINKPHTREQAIEAYTEKYWKKPSHLMKTENIISKL